jgi:hypothetical protein
MCFPAFWVAPATVPANRPAGAARVEEEPVAICRLKRVAADYKGDVSGPAAGAGFQERQARGAYRRRPGLADGGA